VYTRAVRWLCLWFVVLLLACKGSSGGTPAALKVYEQGHEVSRWGRYEISGVELWQVTVVDVDDLTASSVVGVEGGELIAGWELFRRVGEMSAEELVVRAMDMLLAQAPGAVLVPEDLGSLFPDEQRLLVSPPVLADGALVFWTTQGDMAPALIRIRLDLQTGEIERTGARAVLDPPPDPAPPIRAKLESDDAEEVLAGLHAVNAICGLVPDVAALLEHPDRRVQNAALGVLGNLGDPSAVPAIAALMKDGPTWAERSLAGQALLRFPESPEAQSALRQHIAEGSGEEVPVLREALEYHRKNPTVTARRACEPRRPTR
jgi:hypothetical protein